MDETTKLRIHGDNILECENTLKLLSSALSGSSEKYSLIEGPAYAPVYSFLTDKGNKFLVQLFPGYKRWNFGLEQYLSSLGAPLREMPDAIITKLKLKTKHGHNHEIPLLALEFSGALPAGNNAWQRTGRALALAYAGIPYLYFAELGGQELDEDRSVKAARFPNPLVPFAYAALGMNLNSISLPIYLRSSSIHQNVVEIFKDCFGTTESLQIIRGVLLNEEFSQAKTLLEQKIAKTLQVLAQQRKRADILKPEEWSEFYALRTGTQKASWLVEKAMSWNKKTGVKTLTPTFKKLLLVAIKSGAVAIGSKEMPICIIPPKARKNFTQKVQILYKNKVSPDFTAWLSNTANCLVCVWVNGFKPRGDDSRPDRGLTPLARMIFGFEGIDLLTMVYGPAKPGTWSHFASDMHKLAITNGLWEAIINLSDAILIDSSTSKKLKQVGFLVKKNKQDLKPNILPAASTTPNFGEHDVDSVLHLLFSQGKKLGVYESLCNPPGGDWSGISILDFDSNIEYRWTSLPRVSGIESKRPDHIIQFNNTQLLSIESKDVEARLEDAIGPRLIKYIKDLIRILPISFKGDGNEHWEELVKSKLRSNYDVISAAAFRFTKKDELLRSLKRGKVDMVMGIEFIKESKLTKVHLLPNKKAAVLIPAIQKLADRFKNILELIIYT